MNKKILNKAFSIAKLLDNDKQNICAIIVDKKNRILSIGTNSYKKTHPLMLYYSEIFGNSNKIYLHAETDAITKLPYGKQPYAIYVARCGKNGEKRLAKPCKICQGALNDIGIKEIYYTKTKE